MASRNCQLGRRFSACKEPPEQTCVYCGRSFCGEHTHVVHKYEAVCVRKACVRKQLDMEAHIAYRARVAERNGAGLCGVEECGPHPGLQCSLCEGHFCGAHVSERAYPMREGRVVIDRPVSVCSWCWGRRKIWRR